MKQHFQWKCLILLFGIGSIALFHGSGSFQLHGKPKRCRHFMLLHSSDETGPKPEISDTVESVEGAKRQGTLKQEPVKTRPGQRKQISARKTFPDSKYLKNDKMKNSPSTHSWEPSRSNATGELFHNKTSTTAVVQARKNLLGKLSESVLDGKSRNVAANALRFEEYLQTFSLRENMLKTVEFVWKTSVLRTRSKKEKRTSRFMPKQSFQQSNTYSPAQEPGLALRKNTGDGHRRTRRSPRSEVIVTAPDCSYSSCHSQCGHYHLGETTRESSIVPCHCDRSCWLYGDCCFDFYNVCLQVDAAAPAEDIVRAILSKCENYEQVLEFQKSIEFESLSECVQLKHRLYNLVERCSENPNTVRQFRYLLQKINLNPDAQPETSFLVGISEEEVVRRCEQEYQSPDSNVTITSYVIDQTPAVLSSMERINFKNVFCAVCNGIHPSDLTKWEVDLICPGCRECEDETLFLNSWEEQKQSLFMFNCSLEAKPLDEFHVGYCFNSDFFKVVKEESQGTFKDKDEEEYNVKDELLVKATDDPEKTEKVTTTAKQNKEKREIDLQIKQSKKKHRNKHDKDYLKALRALLCQRYQYAYTDKTKKIKKNPHCGAMDPQNSTNDGEVCTSSLSGKNRTTNRLEFCDLFEFQRCKNCNCLYADLESMVESRFRVPTFRILFDFHEHVTTVTVNRTTLTMKTKSCDEGKVYNPYFSECRELHCPSGTQLVGSRCMLKASSPEESEALFTGPGSDYKALPFPDGTSVVKLSLSFRYAFDQTEDSSSNVSTFSRTPINPGLNSMSVLESKNVVLSDVQEGQNEMFAFENVSFSKYDLELIWWKERKQESEGLKLQMLRELRQKLLKIAETSIQRNSNGLITFLMMDSRTKECEFYNTKTETLKEPIEEDTLEPTDCIQFNVSTAGEIKTKGSRQADSDNTVKESKTIKSTLQSHNILQFENGSQKPVESRSGSYKSVTFQIPLKETEPNVGNMNSQRTNLYSLFSLSEDSALDAMIKTVMNVTKDITFAGFQTNFFLTGVDLSNSLETTNATKRCPTGWKLNEFLNKSLVLWNDTYIVQFNNSMVPLRKLIFEMPFTLDISNIYFTDETLHVMVRWCEPVEMCSFCGQDGYEANYSISDFARFEDKLILTKNRAEMSNIISENRYKENGTFADILNNYKNRYPDSQFIVYENGSYEIIDQTVCLCNVYNNSYDEAVLNVTQEQLTYRLIPSSVPEMIATGIAYVVSISCLIIVLAVYSLLPELRNVPGKIVMCFSASLLIAQLLFLLCTVPEGVACDVYSALHHAAWLASFSWQAVMSCDLAYVLWAKSLELTDVSRGHVFRIYFLACCVGPLLVSAVCFTLDKTHVLDIGYGTHGICWIGNLKSLILACVVPCSLFVSVSLMSAGFVIRVLQESDTFRRCSVSVQRRDRSRLALSFSLSMLMGANWLFYVLAVSVNVRPLWILSILVTGSQGLYVFLCFVAKKSLFGKVKARWTEWRIPKDPSSPTAFLQIISSRN